MDATRPVLVVVEMEPTGSTISGQVAVDGAPACEFFGWLELIDRLERAMAGRARAGSGATVPAGSTRINH